MYRGIPQTQILQGRVSESRCMPRRCRKKTWPAVPGVPPVYRISTRGPSYLVKMPGDSGSPRASRLATRCPRAAAAMEDRGRNSSRRVSSIVVQTASLPAACSPLGGKETVRPSFRCGLRFRSQAWCRQGQEHTVQPCPGRSPFNHVEAWFIPEYVCMIHFPVKPRPRRQPRQPPHAPRWQRARDARSLAASARMPSPFPPTVSTRAVPPPPSPTASASVLVAADVTLLARSSAGAQERDI